MISRSPSHNDPVIDFSLGALDGLAPRPIQGLGPGMAQAGGWLGVNGPGVIKRVFLENEIGFKIIMCSELILDSISSIDDQVLRALGVPGVAGACISQDKVDCKIPVT